jgi:uncharacterized protein (DUF362 family)
VSEKKGLRALFCFGREPMRIFLKGAPRRSFLLTFFAALLLFVIFFWRACWRPFLIWPRKGAVSQPGPNRFKEGDKAPVGVVHGRDVEKMVRTAVDLIGGFERLDVRGKTVLLKPNILDGAPPPTTTNPRVIRAVARALFQAGASRVLVGDMSAFFKLPTRKNMETTFIKTMADDVGAEMVPFDEGKWISLDLPKGQLLKKVYVAETFFNVDRVINLPVIKTHRSATYSIALKNMVGATHFRHRPYIVSRSHWEEVIAELNLAFSPDLHIVDGTKIMVEGGPWKGGAIESDLIIATEDRIAADVVGLGVLKHYSSLPSIRDVSVWDQRQVKRAIELGLGVKGPDELEIAEKDLEPTRPGFKDVMETVRKAVLGEKGT